MNKSRIERNVNFLTSKEQSEILWAFIIDFRAITQSVDRYGQLSAKQLDDLSSLRSAVRNVKDFAKEKFDPKINNSFDRLSSLIEDFQRSHIGRLTIAHAV